MKSYTDLEQSKKLAEILPLESADMHYWLAWRGGISEEYKNIPKVGIPNKYKRRKYLWCPCWSLAALLNVLPSSTLDSSDNHRYRFRCMERYTEWYDNAIDACVAMIERLHELKML